MEFTKRIKVLISGSPTKTMGTLIFLVNSAALHQKHLRIFITSSFQLTFLVFFSFLSSSSEVVINSGTSKSVSLVSLVDTNGFEHTGVFKGA